MKPFIIFPDRAGKCFGLLIPLLLLGSQITAQPKLIKANSNKVDIKDGDYFQKEVWNLSPEINPDIYYVVGPVKEKKVIFYTDIDSITVNMQPGHSYDFIILLNGKDSCFTRLVWQSPIKNSGYKKNCRNCIITSDTIPFTLAEDDRIHIRGKINNSQYLDLVFDTGAYGIILSTRGLEKANIHFDGTARGMGFGGNTTVRSSSSNLLEIGGVIWDSIPLVHNAREVFDGVVGYRIFDNKIVEIDYNKRLIIAHAAPFEVDPLYTKLDMELRNQLPFVKISLLIGNTSITEWFCYDSGNSGTINLDDDFSRKYNLYTDLKKLGESEANGLGPNTIKNQVTILPEFRIGNHKFNEVPAFLELPSGDDNISFCILGNEVLQKFNTIIDYQNSYLYLKPNALFSSPLRKPATNKVVHADDVTMDLRPPAWKEYVGTYVSEDGSGYIISLDNNKLMAKPKNGQPLELIPVKEQHFKIKEKNIDLMFVRDKADKVVKIMLSGNGESVVAKKLQ